jgi:linoleoyl-CoA desaturase
MKSGILTENKPVFLKGTNNEIFLSLRERANQIVNELYAKRHPVVILKAILFPLIYICAYITAMLSVKEAAVFYGSYFIMGLMLMIIFINLVHDAVHHVLYKSKRINK